MSRVPTRRTQRLTLRALTLADAPGFRELADNLNVARNLFDGFPQPYTREHAENWCANEGNSGQFGFVWGIVFGERVVGVVGARPDTGWMRCNAEAGWWIGEPFWGCGIASEALAAVVPWVWENAPEITRIYAGVFASNIASQRVAEKCGFVREGQMPQSAIKDGRVIDRTMWATYKNVAL